MTAVFDGVVPLTEPTLRDVYDAIRSLQESFNEVVELVQTLDNNVRPVIEQIESQGLMKTLMGLSSSKKKG